MTLWCLEVVLGVYVRVVYANDVQGECVIFMGCIGDVNEWCLWWMVDVH